MTRSRADGQWTPPPGAAREGEAGLGPHAKPPKVSGQAAANLRWSGAWVRIRRRVLARDNHVCQLQWPGCEGAATHVDHIVPRRFGGEDVDANLRAACRSCNQRRGDGTATPPDPPVSVW